MSSLPAMQHRAERPLAAVVSFSRAARDARVARQVVLLRSLGYRVLVIAYADPNDTIGDIFVPLVELQNPLAIRLSLVAPALPAKLWSGFAHPAALTSVNSQRALRALRKHQPCLIHANDWPALAIAARAKDDLDCSLIYDSHEFAAEENAHSKAWWYLCRKHVMTVERASICKADRVVTVSEGIARELATMYQLREQPTVVRNLPNYSKTTFRPTGDTITVLFHGQLHPSRGLESLIDSVAAWTPDRRLLLRGFGAESYVDSLRQRVRNLGLDERVTFAPAVAQQDVVAYASEADIGVFTPATQSRHMLLSLPNKLFEYLMAGLALCVTPGHDREALIRKYDVGAVTASTYAAELAATINSISAASLNTWRRNALSAAEDLCWEHEQRKLIAVYRSNQ